MPNTRNRKLTTLAAAITLASCASLTQAADTLKIALAGPMTGPVAQYGEMQFDGAEMAVEQLNKAGGVRGGCSFKGFSLQERGLSFRQGLFCQSGRHYSKGFQTKQKTNG